MSEWVPFEEGSYWVETAFLASPEGSGISIEDAVIEVYLDQSGAKRVRGECLASGYLIMELLEDSDTLTLFLDLGGEFKFRLEQPDLIAGKALAKGVRSVLQFAPKMPWEQVPEAEFEELCNRIQFLSD